MQELFFPHGVDGSKVIKEKGLVTVSSIKSGGGVTYACIPAPGSKAPEAEQVFVPNGEDLDKYLKGRIVSGCIVSGGGKTYMLAPNTGTTKPEPEAPEEESDEGDDEGEDDLDDLARELSGEKPPKRKGKGKRKR